jgi:hypothetical protein
VIVGRATAQRQSDWQANEFEFCQFHL